MYRSVIANNSLPPVIVDDLLLYASYLRASGQTELTVRAYLSRVKLFLQFSQHCSIHRSLEETVELFIEYLQDELGYRPASIRNNITAVKNFLKYAGHANLNITVANAQSKTPMLDNHQEKLIVEAIQRTKSIKFKTLTMLILSTGIRVGELRSLRCSCVKFGVENSFLEIDGKQGVRVMPLCAETTLLLLEWMSVNDRKEGDDSLLFPNRRGEMMSYIAIDGIVKAVGRQARLNVCARMLRNTFINRVLQSGADASLVVRLTGCTADSLARLRARFSSNAGN
ncbi:MAG: tyrosine-type recombinase/integrase [Candidatus Obscuribacterales bacterium]|nr:tyrosine-type recombinase/integrase [Candidatus Obscuribacterales bacterium]